MKFGPAHATLTAAVDAAATAKAVGVEARGVRVVLGGTAILRGIDLTVGAGEWVSIVGPNGAGKSTLLAALAGLRRSEGDVAVGGIALRSLTARERARRIGFVPQLPVVPPRMSVVSYVMLGRTPHLPLLGIEGSLDVAVVEETIDLLDLRGLADRMIDSLSGGELRRCQLARVLAQQTPVLLLDEPTAALDLGHQQQALDLLDRLRRERGLTVVTTMHDLTLAGHYSDRMVLLAHGKVEGSGRAEDVLDPALLEQVYGVALRVVRLDERLVVLPGVRLPPASCGGEYRQEALTTARQEEAP